jgi:hypothetical protein
LIIDSAISSYNLEIRGVSMDDRNIFIDNFKYVVLYDNPIYLEGFLSLSDGTDPSEIEITSSANSSQVYHSDSTGFYRLALNSIQQTIFYKKDGYSTKIFEIATPNNNNMYNYDTQLDLLEAPTNLDYTIEDGQIFLTWDFEYENQASQTRNTRIDKRDFQEFQVKAILNETGHVNEYTVETSCELLFNSDVVYDIEVFAIYNCEGITTRSFSSNEVHIDLTNNETPEVPNIFTMSQNYPNPFINNGRGVETSISFSLPYDANSCEINLYDIKGRKVDCLAKGKFRAGVHKINWDGCDSNNKDCASGDYFYRIVTV